jgi:acyl dehydratase
MAVHYFEDFKVGDTFAGGSVDVTQDAIIDYARQFDPQPFHTDPDAAKKTLFGELVASGWHTASMTMRLFATSDIRIVNGIVGGGAEQLSWPQPVRPGDRLTVRSEVLETRPSRSKPDRGNDPRQGRHAEPERRGCAKLHWAARRAEAEQRRLKRKRRLVVQPPLRYGNSPLTATVPSSPSSCGPRDRDAPGRRP